jgi:hypothetical protein
LRSRQHLQHAPSQSTSHCQGEAVRAIQKLGQIVASNVLVRLQDKWAGRRMRLACAVCQCAPALPLCTCCAYCRCIIENKEPFAHKEWRREPFDPRPYTPLTEYAITTNVPAEVSRAPSGLETQPVACCRWMGQIT